jgi:uncharacterized membrane protein (DUF373 family)
LLHSGTRKGSREHDPQAEVRRLPALFAQARPENRQEAQPRDVQEPRRRAPPRARGAVLQAELTLPGATTGATAGGKPSRTRTLIARGFAGVEDLVYIGLGVLLAACAIALLLAALLRFGSTALSGEAASQIIPLLDRILLILLVVELLYTVQVSFRLHAVTPEPFLLVGLIAAIRRVLLLTAEFGHPAGAADPSQLVPELAVLSGLIVAISASLFVLRRRDTTDRIPKP